MPLKIPSPLSQDDLDHLEALAGQANAHTLANGYAPLYMAIDIGDARHENAYLFLCWPALDSRSVHCARMIFDYIADVVKIAFDAAMVPTSPQGAPDAPHR